MVPTTTVTRQDRLKSANVSLQGLSVGDAFGEQFFISPNEVETRIRNRQLPPAPWPVTDDTVMALSIVDVLAKRERIDCDLLAALFGKRYRWDSARGYGGTAHDILSRLASGRAWRELSVGVFGGLGSMGNGGAMRAAPIGAYFFDDFLRAAEEAKRSAAVTHAGTLSGAFVTWRWSGGPPLIGRTPSDPVWS